MLVSSPQHLPAKIVFFFFFFALSCRFFKPALHDSRRLSGLLPTLYPYLCAIAGDYFCSFLFILLNLHIPDRCIRRAYFPQLALKDDGNRIRSLNWRTCETWISIISLDSSCYALIY